MNPALRSLLDAMLHAAWLVEPERLDVAAANPAAGELFGCEPCALIGRPARSLAGTPEDLCFWDEAAAGTAGALLSETFVTRADGSAVPVTRRIAPVRLDSGTAWLVSVHDRSTQLASERALEIASAELAATLESTDDGLLVCDLSGRIRQFNRRFAELWGVPRDLLQQGDDQAVKDWMRRSVVDPEPYQRRLDALENAALAQSSEQLVLHSGTVVERVSRPQCSGGRPIGRVYSFRDVTERVAAQRRIEQLSHHDLLTGLPNRGLLADRLERALALARRDGTPFALLLLNLDRFSQINETFGHAVADRVLVEVSERLQGCVRQIDTIARLGGDEFVLLAQRSDASGAETAARRVMEALQRPFVVDGLTFTVTGSIGIALHPTDGAGLDPLLGHADAAMRDVKQSGRNAWRFRSVHAAVPDTQLRTRMRLDHAMRLALAQQRFRLHYQPQVDLASGEVVGAEALIRWRDPEMGEVSPSQFIPVAEESGFIVAIGDWVLRQAVTQAALWHAKGRPLRIAVNVSALQFRQAGFVDGVAATLRAADLPPQWLELELTESILIQDAEDTLARLQALARLGVHLSVDDFGTGYSSLGYLKRLPIGRLKIDRSFVSDLPEDSADAGIVSAIIDLARALRLEVVAEGVETEGQRNFLRRAGCDQFQGFLYAPALDVRSFESLLDKPDQPQRVIPLRRQRARVGYESGA